jgi:hypothetical protein
MFDVEMRRENETRTHVEMIDTIAVTPGTRVCTTSPKIELTGQTALQVGLSYGAFEGTGTLQGTAKITVAVEKCYTPIVTKYKKARITEQRQRVVMGQGFKPLGIEWLSPYVVDELEEDIYTHWRVVDRDEFEEEVTEESNVTTRYVDPPGAGTPNTALILSSGQLNPSFAFIDGMTIPIQIGTTQSQATVQTHAVLLDGVKIDESLLIQIRGTGPLSTGDHILTVSAQTDLGVVTFDIPVRVNPSPELRIIDSITPFLYDEQRAISIELKNNESTGRNVAVFAVASPGWNVSVTPLVWVPASSYITVQLIVHAASQDERTAIGKLEVTAFSNGGDRATISVDLLAHFPVQRLRVYEREIVQAALAWRNLAPVSVPAVSLPLPAAPLARAVTANCGQSPQTITYTQPMTVTVTIKNTGTGGQDCSVTVMLKDQGSQVRGQGTVDPGDDEIHVSGTKVKTVELTCSAAPTGQPSAQCKFTYTIASS